MDKWFYQPQCRREQQLPSACPMCSTETGMIHEALIMDCFGEASLTVSG